MLKKEWENKILGNNLVGKSFYFVHSYIGLTKDLKETNAACNYEGITIIATTQNKDFFKNLSSVYININHGRITSVRSSVKKKYNKK